jgi:peptide alpha-N-acetyltransferase
MLYHVRLLEELGEFTEALAMLDVNAKSRAIVDRTAIMEIRGARPRHSYFHLSNFF